MIKYLNTKKSLFKVLLKMKNAYLKKKINAKETKKTEVALYTVLGNVSLK